MAKAYLCPHCGARNRFEPANITDGVARCGACAQPFAIPNYKPNKNPRRLATAVIESRYSVPAAPVEHRIDPERARAQTLIVGESRPASKGSHSNSPVTRPTSGSNQKPPSSDAYARPIIRGPGHAAPAAMKETSASSASTQPTNPPPEYRNSNLQETQDSTPLNYQVTGRGGHGAFPTMYWWTAVACLAILGGVTVSASLESRHQKQTKKPLPEWTQLKTRAMVIGQSVKTAMADGRPDIAAAVLRSHPDALVIRASGTQAFVPGNRATHYLDPKTACTKSSSGIPKTPAAPVDTDKDSDSRMACDRTDEDSAEENKPELSRYRSHWSTTEAVVHVGSSSHVTAPIHGQALCDDCKNGTQNNVLAWVVIPAPQRMETVSSRPYLETAAGSTVTVLIMIIAVALRRRSHT